MPIALISFEFDPLLQLGDDLVVRWQTVALAAIIAVVLVLSGLLGRGRHLRADDLLSIMIGAVPGAVVAGRLGYLALHPEAFAAGPASFIDPSVGSLELATGVIGGALTAAYVAMLLGTSVRAWAHLVAIPLLVAIGAGKLSMVLGGSGQGLQSDLSWATAYLGPGPWASLVPELSSHPSQAYEGVATLALATTLALLGWLGLFQSRDGRLLLVAVGGWALVRAAVTTSWRDPVMAGPLPAAGWLALVIAVACVVLAGLLTIRSRSAVPGSAGRAGDGPAWPDPTTRPQF
ncbi:MAG: prolipoprotein diacylglyceryl transferase family protein [Candidatus Limnocylindrales bacterium]